MPRKISLTMMFLLISAAPGCQPIQYTSPDRYQQGLVVCLGGAGGISAEVDRIRRGLYTSRLEYAIESFEWSQGDILKDQTDLKANRRQARRLARRIEAYCAEYPSQPVYLVGKSAGTGVVVWALEELDPNCRVNAAFLIASSLYRAYDLTDALAPLTNRMYILYSPADSVLALAATTTGTVDRQHGQCGGLKGFVLPDHPGPYTKAIYQARIAQRGWRLADIFQGHFGGHFGASNPEFVRRHIAPLIAPRNNQPP